MDLCLPVTGSAVVISAMRVLALRWAEFRRVESKYDTEEE
jgi:hypothetical protein